MLTAEIITTGTELLMGKVVNTNATWIARRLVEVGITVKRITSVPDDIDEISSCIKEALRREVDLIVVTGGLGPSKDDLTAEALARALNQQYVLNKDALKMVRERLRERGLPLTSNRIKMAYMPEKATPLPNLMGVAPGIMVRKGKTLIVALPGVPGEMKALFEKYVMPKLERITAGSLIEGTLVVSGVPESEIVSLIDLLNVNEECDIYIKTRVLRIGIEIYISSFRQDCQDVIIEVLRKVKEMILKMGGTVISDINLRKAQN